MFTIQCDFDDTVTVGDVGTEIVAAFGPKEWEEEEVAYLAGKMSVEETVRRQYGRVKVSPKELDKFIRQKTVVREGFFEFVSFCQAQDISLVIVSSGLDLYIEPILSRFGLTNVEHYTGNASLNHGSVTVEYKDPRGQPIQEGFKMAYFNLLKQRGRPIVYIGDSMSDIVPATKSNYILARGVLENQLRARGVPFFPFDDFNDVIKRLESLKGQKLR